MPTFVTPGPITAAVEVAGAQVRVAATDRPDSQVLVQPLNGANPSDVKVASGTKVDFDAGRLTVKTTVPGDKKGSVAITIELPADSGLVANLAYSSVDAEGPLGGCELHLASGRAQLDSITSLQANVADGEVTIGHIAGRAIIGGSAVAMRVGRASADIALSSSSGSLDIDRADGSVTATTADGALRIGRMTRGRVELMNRSGTIEIGISAGTAARVDASSERGSVRNSVPLPDGSGPFENEVTIQARTRYGNIVIQPAAS